MMDTLLLLALNGLIWGLIIALIALGLSIIFGLLDVINIAHGDFFMVGTVLAWFTLEATGNFWLGFLRRAAGRFHSRCVDAACRDPTHPRRCRAVDRRDLRPLTHPSGKRAHRVRAGAAPILPPITGTIPLFGIEYDIYRIFAAALSIAALVAFFLFLQHTTVGTWMRAVRHDRDTAIAMGIPAKRIYVLTFGIGFALAAFGGAVAAPITTVDFRGGVDILPVCFMAVIIGGLGNLPGTAAAAVLLAFFEGVIQSVADPTIARIASLVLMSAVLLLRPQGLFKGHTR